MLTALTAALGIAIGIENGDMYRRYTHKIQHLLCFELCLYKFMGVCLLSRLCMCGDVDVWARISDENETFVSIVWEKGEKTPPNW